MVTYEQIFKKAVFYMVEQENHRYQNSYENNIAQLYYIFQFFNCYLSNFLLAFWYGDFAGLTLNLIVQLVAKQIGVNCFEYFQFRVLHGRKVRAVYKKYNDAIDEALEDKDYQLHKKLTIFKHAEAQYAMAEEKDLLVFYYNEAMVQFGFIVFFSQVFTLAPLFSLCTNFLEIKIKLDGMGKYSRRMKSEGS